MKSPERWRRRWVDGQLVTLREVRLWMAAVPKYPGLEGSHRWWCWVRDYRIAEKVAAEMKAGTFHQTVLRGLSERGRFDHRAIRRLKSLIAVAERGQPSR